MRSPLALEPARLSPLAGVRLGATASGVRESGRPDLMLAEFAPGTQVAGVFTRSATASAAVEWSRAVAARGEARALAVNSGNANAFTGKAGAEAVRATAEAAAALVGCAPESVCVSSTGVIGEPLPTQKILAALPGLRAALAPDGWAAAAEAIMTTDTFVKTAAATADIDGRPVAVNGIAKGSGMIAPDMATMLAYLVTDAALPAPVLRALLKPAVDRTFNAITVDGDTSTSDTVLLFATGATPPAPPPSVGRRGGVGRRLADFRRALERAMLELAHRIVRDGEGASKFVAVTVSGAANARAARRIAFAIANSPLVKTALAGEDPNWGRVVMAVGKAGEKADRDRLSIRFGPHLVAERGAVREGYDEAPVAAYMKRAEIAIDVDVGVGRGEATVWTCDLTHGYVSINADYRS